MLYEPADHPHQLPQQLLLALGGVQRLVHVVGKIVIFLQPLLECRATHELRLEVQRPSVIHLACAVVSLAYDLSGRDGYQRPLRRVIVGHAVFPAFREIVLHEEGIHIAHLVQRVGYRAQFVEVDDAHHRVIRHGSYALCVVVGVVEVEVILRYHAAKLLLFTQIVAPKAKKINFGKYSVDSDNRRKRILPYLCTR